MLQADEDSKKYWSNPAEVSVLTKATHPYNSPVVCSECFEFSGDNFVNIYWRRLKKIEENGPGFEYEIYELGTIGEEK
jgi:hypothetical protein